MDDLEDLARRQVRARLGLGPSHARPRAWFVLSGRGAVLLVVVLVTMWVVPRDGTTLWPPGSLRHWWGHPPAAETVSPPPVVRPQPAPSRVTLATGSRPAIGVDAAEWITSGDYPAESIRSGEEGVSAIRWRIDVDGRVRRCGVIRSSGYPRLDAAACGAIIRRAFYQPALDTTGRAIPATQQRRVRWVLPEE